MKANLKEADITFKARGSEFEFIKIIWLEEKETCTLKIQEVLFGDFKMFDLAKKEFIDLISVLDNCIIPFPAYSDGKSGTHYQLEIRAGENAMNFNWYGESPGEQWNELVGFTKKLVGLKEKYNK